MIFGNEFFFFKLKCLSASSYFYLSNKPLLQRLLALLPLLWLPLEVPLKAMLTVRPDRPTSSTSGQTRRPTGPSASVATLQVLLSAMPCTRKLSSSTNFKATAISACIPTALLFLNERRVPLRLLDQYPRRKNSSCRLRSSYSFNVSRRHH